MSIACVIYLLLPTISQNFVQNKEKINFFLTKQQQPWKDNMYVHQRRSQKFLREDFKFWYGKFPGGGIFKIHTNNPCNNPLQHEHEQIHEEMEVKKILVTTVDNP